MGATTKGFPFPDAGDANNVPADIEALADAVDAAPGIASLTTVQRDALAGGDLWAGRVIWNQTTTTLQRYDGSAWRNLEQGAWTSYTPTVTASTGTFTSASATGAYCVVGTMVHLRVDVSITTNGTAAGAVVVTLPASLPVGGGLQWTGMGRDAGGGGSGLPLLLWTDTASTVAITRLDVSYPGGDGTYLHGQITYRVA